MPAPKGNKYNEKYTLEIALDLFEQAKEILIQNPDIITETELIFKCKYELSLPFSSYTYLRDEKFPKDLEDIKKEIESILESRVMKSKEMYPGIAAMTLKNKHKWRDQQELNVIVYPTMQSVVRVLAGDGQAVPSLDGDGETEADEG